MSEPQHESVSEKIVRCARAGELADFRADTVDGAKPVVAAAFLSDLWLGIIDSAPVHPFGIAIAGLRVEGTIELGGARIDHRMRSPLVGFMAHDCDFPDAINLANVRVESIIVERCSIGTTDVEAKPALDMSAAEVMGQITIVDTAINGHADLSNCAIDDDVTITKTRCSGAINLNAAEIRGALRVTDVVSGSMRFVGLTAVDAVIGSYVEIVRCSFAGSVDLSHCRAVSIVVTRSRFGVCDHSISLLLKGAQIGQDITLSNSSFSQIVHGEGMTAGGDIDISRCICRSGAPGNASLFLARCRAGRSIRVYRSVLHDWMSLDSAIADVGISLERVKISTLPNLTAVEMGSVATHRLNMISCRISGKVDMQGSRLESYLYMHRCAISTGMDLQRTRVAGWVSLIECGFGNMPGEWSLIAHSLHDCEMIYINSCHFTAGFAGVKLSAIELQIEGNFFGAVGGGQVPETALWLSEANIARLLTFGLYSGGPASVAVENRVHGTIDISNTSIGQDLKIRSTTVERPAEYRINRTGTVIDLSGASIGGALSLSATSISGIQFGLPERPAAVHGAIVLDRAKIEGDVRLGGGTRVTALGAIRRPQGDSADEHRVRRLKRGVALSAIGTKIGGTLDIGSAAIAGIVDLRDADVGTIADANGLQWRRIGVQLGHLLLDGLAYRDLDDDEDRTSDHEPHRGGDAVDRRIRWLAMQYPGGQPSAATFVPQPYDQLARFYAQSGNERSRRRVHIARRDLQRQHGGLGLFERSVARLLSWTSGYGYLPGRAAAMLLALLALGAVGAWSIALAGGIVPTNAAAPSPQPFNALLYAVDVAVPVLDLAQDSGWTIAPAKLPGWWWGHDWIVPVGLALYRLAGLVLVSVTVLTFSGILREKE